MGIATIVTDGTRQTVTLPEDVRIEAERVEVRREGDRVVMEPVPKPRPSVGDWLDSLSGGFDEEAARYALEKYPPLPDRPGDKSPFD